MINPQGEGHEVNIVPSQGTLKSCKGFGEFRVSNGLADGSRCKFVLRGPNTLVISPVPAPRRRRHRRGRG